MAEYMRPPGAVPADPPPEGPKLVGGRLCLDFVNTVSGRPPARRTRASGTAAGSIGRERLGTYPDLVHWSRRAGALTRGEADRLLGQARRRPPEAGRALRRAVGLREAIYRICIAVVKGWRAAAGDLELLNRELAAARARERVVAGGKRFAWEWDRRIPDLDRMLWPVARSAAELLTSPDLVFTRACQGEDCGWLFLDTSRNRTRRWCDMSDCGNLAKVRRFRRRRGRAR
jgi:predicted RNA-binding Zn ribbon-like protein